LSSDITLWKFSGDWVVWLNTDTCFASFIFFSAGLSSCQEPEETIVAVYIPTNRAKGSQRLDSYNTSDASHGQRRDIPQF